MGAHLRLDGFAELREALRRLPVELTAEGGTIVMDAAAAAMNEMMGNYPERAERLKGGLRIKKTTAGPFGASALVENTSPLAFIFEQGTQTRHTDLGANRGAMPPGHIFVPVMIRQRRAMMLTLRGLLERHGLRVSGNA